MCASFKELFGGVQNVLSEELDISHGLLVELLSKGVLLQDHVDEIKNVNTESKKAEKMMELLQRGRNPVLIPAFKEALTATGQEYIWNKYLSSKTSTPSVHMRIASASMESSQLRQVDTVVSDSLLNAVKLVNRHISMADVASTKEVLQNADKSLLDKGILLADFYERIKKVLRQDILDAAEASKMSVLLLSLILYDTPLAFAHTTHSIVLYFICNSLSDVNNVKKLVDSGLLHRLLTDVVIERIGSPDVTVELRLNPDHYEVALNCFDENIDNTIEAGTLDVKAVPQFTYFDKLPIELLELILLNACAQLFDAWLGTLRSISTSGVNESSINSEFGRPCFMSLAAVCNGWRYTIIGWQESRTRYWFKHKFRRALRALWLKAAAHRINTFVFFDINTTGLTDKPRITEISMLAMHRIAGDEMIHKVRKTKWAPGGSDPPPDLPRAIGNLKLAICPMKPIGFDASEITGLNNDNLYQQKDFDPELGDIIRLFLRRLEPPVCLVAHNGHRFDYPLFLAELQATGCKPLILANDEPVVCIDTFEMFRDLSGNPVNFPNRYLLESPNKTLPEGKRLRLDTEQYNVWNTIAKRRLHQDIVSCVTSVNSDTTVISDSGVETDYFSDTSKCNRHVVVEVKSENVGVSSATSLTPSSQKATEPKAVNKSMKRPARTPVPGTSVLPAKIRLPSCMTAAKRPSYKLVDLHQRIIGFEPADKDDCLSLARIFWLTPRAVHWADHNAVGFDRFRPLYATRRRPLPSGKFPSTI